MPKMENQSAPGADYDHKPSVSRAETGQKVRTAMEGSTSDVGSRKSPNQDGPGTGAGAQNPNG